MATFKAVIRPSERKNDGTWGVKIRVTHNRKYKFIQTPFFVTSNQITRNYKIKDVSLLDKLDDKIKEYRDKVIDLGFSVNDMNVEQLVDILTSGSDNENAEFFAFANEYIDNIKRQKRIGTYNAYITSVNSILQYNKSQKLYFRDITSQYMYGYFCSIEHNKPNTIRSYITAIKTIYNAAKLKYNDEDNNIIIVRNNVFKRIKLPKSESNKDLSLSVEQMQAIIDVPYCGTRMFDFTKDMFVLSFVCFGMNAKDMFYVKKSQYKDGILTYRRSKIERRNGIDAEMKILVPEVGRKILEKYNGDDTYLIDFGELKRSNYICRYIHNTFQQAGVEEYKGYLSKVGHVSGTYTFYTARHTMASLARNECGIDFMIVHEMLNHVAPNGFSTTDVYIKKDYKKLWEANDKLMGLFDWSFYLNQ